jgi:hypothetical protein
MGIISSIYLKKKNIFLQHFDHLLYFEKFKISDQKLDYIFGQLAGLIKIESISL